MALQGAGGGRRPRAGLLVTAAGHRPRPGRPAKTRVEAAVPAPRERAKRRSELFSPPDGLPTAEKPLLDGEFTAEGGFLELKKKKKKKGKR